jgi:hypothetical protein
MLVRLTRTKRTKAGWFVALVYLLCVLAPTISYALPGEHSVAPCLTHDGHMSGMMRVHSDAPARHVHSDGHVHEHAAAHHVVDVVGDHIPTKIGSNSKQVPENAPHSPDGQCCGLMCVSALPATLIDIATPSVPTAICQFEGYRKVTDNAPHRLYRPPIS